MPMLTPYRQLQKASEFLFRGTNIEDELNLVSVKAFVEEVKETFPDLNINFDKIKKSNMQEVLEQCVLEITKKMDELILMREQRSSSGTRISIDSVEFKGKEKTEDPVQTLAPEKQIAYYMHRDNKTGEKIVEKEEPKKIEKQDEDLVLKRREGN